MPNANFANRIRESKNYSWIALATVSIGTVMSSLDGSIVNIALPTISSRLHIDIVNTEWIVLGYLLATTVFLPIFGKLADIIGRKLIYNIGFVIFSVGSLFCAFAGSFIWLVISRVVQAIGASMIVANGLAIITDAFPFKKRGVALGIMGTVVASGSSMGPPLGGFLVQHFGWNSIFLINVPIGVVGTVIAFINLRKDKKVADSRQFDFPGAALFVVSISALVLALMKGADFGWGSVKTIGLFLVFLLGFALFIVLQLRVKNPLIYLGLFKNRMFLIGNLSGFVAFASSISLTYLMPFYLERIYLLPPSFSGLVMLSIPISMSIMAPISGWICDRIGTRWPATLGLFLGALAIFLISFLQKDSSLIGIIARLTLAGAGMGIFMAPNNNSVMSSAPKSKLGVASGILSVVRNLGWIMGMAFIAVLISIRQPVYDTIFGNDSPAALLRNMAEIFRITSVTLFIASVISSLRGKHKHVG